MLYCTNFKIIVLYENGTAKLVASQLCGGRLYKTIVELCNSVNAILILLAALYYCYGTFSVWDIQYASMKYITFLCGSIEMNTMRGEDRHCFGNNARANLLVSCYSCQPN